MKKLFILSLIAAFFTSMNAIGQRDLDAPHFYVDKTVIKKGVDTKGPKGGLFESFETDFPPAGWTKINPDGGTGWAQTSAGTSPLPGWTGGTVTVPEGGGDKVAYATWNTGGSSSNDQWLITPALTIADGDILTFWLEVQNASSYMDHVEVLLSTTDNSIGSFTEELYNLDFTADLPWTEYTYDLSAYDGETVYIAFREAVADNFNDGAFVALDLVQVGAIDPIDATLVSINTPDFGEPGEIYIPGTIYNNGTDDITSFDVTYTIDGGAASPVYSVTGVAIALGETYDFTHDVPENFGSDGTYTIEVTIANVNGGGETSLDDNMLSKDITISSEFVQRKIILENFTTGQCPNCPPIHSFLESYVEGEPNAILIAQHAGYYTDPMTIPENTELLALYNDGGSTFAPALCIDRYHYSEGLTGGAPDPGPVFWPGESTAATTTRMDERIAQPAYVSVSINGDFNTDGSIDITVHGQLLTNVPGDDLRLVVYILEDSLIYPQSGGSSDYVHNNVMRDAISDTWGDAGIITSNTAGTTFSEEYSYTLDSEWNAEKMYVVAFVANYDGGDVNNRAILNAEEVKLTEMIPVSVSEVNSWEENVYVFPNPATDVIRISNAENSEVEIYNTMGSLLLKETAVSSSTTIDISVLDKGTYFVRILSDNGVATRKIIIH